MAVPIVIDAIFFFLAFSAFPVSIIYRIKSREGWILPYILIQIVTSGYVCADILFTGAGRHLVPGFSAALYCEILTALRILLMVLVPVFLNSLLDLSGKKARIAAWSGMAAGSLAACLFSPPAFFDSPGYLWVSAVSVALACYTVTIAARLRNRLWGPVGITNKLFIAAGPVYILYLLAFTICPLFTDKPFITLGISFTNLCYGIWNLVFIRFLISYIAAKPLSASDSPLIDTFLKTADFTEREAEILRMVIEGFSNKEAAYRLSISEGTVKTHLFNAFTKAGIHTRVELMNAVYADRRER